VAELETWFQVLPEQLDRETQAEQEQGQVPQEIMVAAVAVLAQQV
jgi:hypothetical protein